MGISRDIKVNRVKPASCAPGFARMFLAFIPALSLLSLIGCGRSSREASPLAAAVSLPGYLSEIPRISSVRPGSEEVLPRPAPGDRPGAFLLQLEAQPGAAIRWRIGTIEDSEAPMAAAALWEGPILLTPPVELSAFSEKDGKRGPVQKFVWGWAAGEANLGTLLDAPRLPLTGPAAPQNFLAQKSLSNTETETLDVRGLTQDFVLDGRPREWSLAGSYFARDGQLDVPTESSAIDLAWLQVVETENEILVGLATRGLPRATATYGLDIGPSGVSETSFGSGANFVYKAEVTSGRLSIRDMGEQAASLTEFPLPGFHLGNRGEALQLSGSSGVFIAEIIEWRIAKSDLPKIDGVQNIIIRAWATEVISPQFSAAAVRTWDRMRPLYLRPSMAATTSATPILSGLLDFKFMAAPDMQGDFATSHHAMAASLYGDLERFAGIPMFEVGSSVLTFAGSDVSGYAGLNSTDRGMLTTFGGSSTQLERTQLLAHEIAHYQNALLSSLENRWLKEGMSEWAAERLLYRYFPARAVHRYLKELRIDPYFSSVGTGSLDELPLATWAEAPSDIGYSKSAMFFNLLEARVGAAPLKKAFQAAVSRPMDSEAFRDFLERETGVNLADLFSFWVEKGTPQPDSDPRELFVDLDGDGLLDLDEEILGTDPSRFDSDFDGMSDDEEIFRGFSPVHSNIEGVDELPKTRSVRIWPRSQDFSGSREMLHATGGPGSELYWSIAPGATAAQLEKPLQLFAPWNLYLQSRVDQQSGPWTEFSQSLWRGNAAVETVFDSDLILPQTPRKQSALLQNWTRATGLGNKAEPTDAEVYFDAVHELPSHLAALDIESMGVREDDTHWLIRLKTVGPADPNGTWGDINFGFDSVRWTLSGIFTASHERTRHAQISIRQGAAVLTEFGPGSQQVSSRPKSGLALSWKDAADGILEIKVARSLIPEWDGDDDEKSLCVWSDVHVSAQHSIVDDGGCLVFKSPQFHRISGKTASEHGPLALEVFVPQSFLNATYEALAERVLHVGLSALVSFEKALARPLPDRRLAQLHFFPRTTGSLGGLSLNLTGSVILMNTSFVSDPVGQEALVIEQLARTLWRHIENRKGSTSLPWVEELWVQWLTAAALYDLRPSRDAHAWFSDRIGEYMCWSGGVPACSSYFVGDGPLASWDRDTSSTSASDSIGPTRSRMLAVYLDAELGSESVARVLSSWVNHVPDTTTIKAHLKLILPAQASVIDQIFATWIEGSGSVSADTTAIRVLMSDADDDGLRLFEEEKLGFSPTVADDWLDP
jgi:hypothetical protein